MASLAICVRAQSSGGSPGSHAANNGGFSQPPTLAPSTPANTPTAANPNAAPDINNVNPNVNGVTPGNTAGAVTNSVNAFGDTNNSAANGFGTNNGVAPAIAAQNRNAAAAGNQAIANAKRNMNADGDVTNANGTMTFNTNSPHWWEKH